jgi:hypothetical protein
MVWDVIMLVGILVGATYALRWAIRTDRASRGSALVVKEAESILREAAGSSHTP